MLVNIFLWGFLVLGIYLVMRTYLVLRIFLVEGLVHFLMLIFIVLYIFLMNLLNPFLFLLIDYLILFGVREVGHHPLTRQPQPKLDQVRLWRLRSRRRTRAGTT